jgi:hypothetical protein
LVGVRLVVVWWPEDVPRGAVSSFCVEHGISRETFYLIRRRVVSDGPDAALAPRSRRPKTSPAALAGDVKRDALGVRVALEASGLDHGPISVFEWMMCWG